MPVRKPNDLGPEKRKLHPKLRMIVNGSSKVNAIRADQSSCLAIPRGSPLLAAVIPPCLEQTRPQSRTAVSVSTEKGKQKAAPTDILTSVFIETAGSANDSGAIISGASASKGQITAATVSLDELQDLINRREITQIEPAEPIAAPTPVIATLTPKPPSRQRWQFGAPNQHHKGKDVLIGIIDVGGFDFAHADFLDADGNTRWVAIWDQGGTRRASPGVRGSAMLDYGAEFTKEHLNSAIRASKQLGVPAHEVEPQSQMADASHGTHVASIAAGNRGVCTRSPLAGVLISLGEGDQDRRLAFADSARIVHAVEYLLDIGDKLRLPVSINISLGTNGHAHDASNAVNRWLDAALSVPGRSICVAAGNAGQEVAEFEGDRGYVMGRIHTSGQIASRGLDADLEWLVVGNGVVDVTENELEIWYSPQDRFAISLRPPGGTQWIGPVEPRQYIENLQLKDGTLVSIYNELYQRANGSNLIAIYLSPFFNEEAPIGIRSGMWTVRLHGQEVRDGRFHGWIERDDPRRLGRIGAKEFWSFPSFFSERSNMDNSSVSSLACGRFVVSVANLDETRGRINITSSQGPTRDERCKPEVAAPGTEIVAARGFSPEGEDWVAMTGTSMASPYVTGVVGLMLAINPALTAAQIGGIIQRTSRPLPGGTYSWANDAGFGVINPEACLAEAAQANERTDITRTV